MKKKWHNGQPFYFSTDSGIETLAHKLLEYLKELPNDLLLKEQLEMAGWLYINADAESKNMIFNRPIVLGHDETIQDRANHWVGEAIKAILTTIKNKESFMNIDVVDIKNNSKGLTRYKTSQGNFILKSIFSPNSILISSSDYLKMNDMVKSEIGMELNEMDGQQFNRLYHDISHNLINWKTELSSLTFTSLSDDWDKKSTEVKGEKKQLFQLLKNENKLSKLNFDKMDKTMDVFDIDDEL